jgi:RNA polymerase sigma factor (sigma-70 family)
MPNSTPKELFESHLNLASKIGRSFSMANISSAESVQEALIALWSAAQSFDPAKGEFEPFASTVIRNHLRNAYNKAKRRSVEITTLDMAVSDDGDFHEKTLKEIIPSPDASPLLEAERVDVRATIRQGLDGLTVSQREVMESFAEGKSYAEIAREKGVSKAAVRQMAERAADQMRPELRARGSVQFMPEVCVPEPVKPQNWELQYQRKSKSLPLPVALAIIFLFTVAMILLLILATR